MTERDELAKKIIDYGMARLADAPILKPERVSDEIGEPLEQVRSLMEDMRRMGNLDYLGEGEYRMNVPGQWGDRLYRRP
jgi:hypothetical protein